MNFGPCMCGDTQCPSCGPAQGYNLDEELVIEWLEALADESNLNYDADPVNAIWYVVELLGKPEVASNVREAMLIDATKWKNNKYKF